MPSTFLELTNDVLTEFNQVEIAQSDFASARGIYTQAKKSVNNSLREIMTAHHQWPFNAVEQTDTLVPGTFEYAWPSDFKTVEMESFQIQKDDTLNIRTETLIPVERTYFYRNFYDDARMGNDDTGYRNFPVIVFRTHGQGYGIFPNPDEAYELKYRYYSKFIPLVNHDDETTVPEEFNHVIIWGAKKHMNYFLDNLEQARAMSEEEFKPALSAMRTLLINDDLEMQDTMVRR